MRIPKRKVCLFLFADKCFQISTKACTEAAKECGFSEVVTLIGNINVAIKSAGFCPHGHIVGRNMPDITPPRLNLLDFPRINIQTQHPTPRLRKLQTERQADVAEADNSYFKFRSLVYETTTLV
jgi:hypothetical protein